MKYWCNESLFYQTFYRQQQNLEYRICFTADISLWRTPYLISNSLFYWHLPLPGGHIFREAIASTMNRYHCAYIFSPSEDWLISRSRCSMALLRKWTTPKGSPWWGFAARGIRPFWSARYGIGNQILWDSRFKQNKLYTWYRIGPKNL